VENAQASTAEEPQPESAGAKAARGKKRVKRVAGEESLPQMRVNSVLQINSAIQEYRFDQQNELWCEVSLEVLHQMI